MKVKVSTASGLVLRYCVAKADGWSNEGLEDIANGDTYPEHDFDVNWSLAGPIIEREKLTVMNRSVTNPNLQEWFAVAPEAIALAIAEDDDRDAAIGSEGPTPLVAAMRAFVASKLGDTVEVPEELT